MRTASEPMRGMIGLLLAALAFFFGVDFLAPRFFTATFFVERVLEMLRALPEELTFFMLGEILHVRGADVNADC